jgi:hypothetical protein
MLELLNKPGGWLIAGTKLKLLLHGNEQHDAQRLSITNRKTPPGNRRGS